MDGRIPQPHDVKDSAEFVAVMRQLRQWADLSYRELERRAGAAGDVLPRATLAGALNRQELPREELVAAFVRASGGDEATVEAWVGVRKRLAVEVEQEPSDAEGPSATDITVPSPTVEAESVAEPVAAHDPGPVAEGPELVPQDPEPLAEDPEPVAENPDPVPDLESSPRTPQPKGSKKPKGLKAAGRRLRRPGVVIAATVAIVLLTAAATAILRPGDRPDEPRESSHTEAPAAATPSDTPSRPSGGATSSAADAKPIEDEPSATEPRETSSTTAPPKTTAPKEPKPTRSSPTPTWSPYDPPSLPDDPPPSTETVDPSDLPEETCWDVTNDCT
ncbi:hypothetical protein SBI_04427 [Streptomyces bingchenggensis BCW-1]|uniref:Uncharacterized protein n=1 Tax=Streptomyces bingchenggensis (strain BCW-1) TaxID=749414 RepID=D7BVE6_STRBB|nr:MULTISPECIES: transcriptional regulator [Streptomyces]ADI07547.1 hypothetical protein SBI_04427 [Streptomyces bingchenggensis BCW-1]